MEALFPVLIAIIVVIVFAIILSLLLSAKAKIDKHTHKPKGRQTIIKEATRKLASDPHNPTALSELGNLYYQEHNWEKALPIFDTLSNVSVARSGIDVSEVSLKQGICAANLNKPQEALKGLIEARKLKPDTFDVNFYLGKVLLMTNDFEKAIPLLKKAITINNEIPETYSLLGKAFYSSKKYRESLGYLRRALDNNPEDKELLFFMADALNESGSSEKAIKVFMHLRPDPKFGAQSCLASGIYHTKLNQIDKAIKDFEIGIKHETAPIELQTNIKYRLAQCYIQQNDMTSGLNFLKQIQLINPNYKDVQSLIAKYQELNQNSNLRTYLIGTNSDFVALCRKIAVVFFKNSRVKILDISVTAECAEVFTEIDTDKWEDNIIFRFYRTTGSTGEIYIRDFHAKIRDEKAGRGICFTAGTYTDEARKYIDGRPIDLLDKIQLAKILSSVEANSL